MKKVLLGVCALTAICLMCLPVSAEEKNPEGCSVEHPELCIEPMGCTAPDCMFG
ncbi:MAG: hypothetical protein ACLSA6_15610 [Holdemania massiliensis]